MLISQSRTKLQSSSRVLGRAIPASEWLEGGGGQALPALHGVAFRQMGQQRIEGLKPLAPEAPPRYLLRPKAVVSRARMVRFSVAWKKVNRCANAARGWELVNRFFPETVAGYNPLDLALDLLGGFLHQVEDAGWFEIDWRTIDWFWEIIYNEDTDGMTPRELDFGIPTERDLLACLEWIPVKRYNWSDEEWWNMDEYPLLTIFKKLLDPTYHIATGYDMVDTFHPSVGWVKQRCVVVAERRGEPFDILPGLVDYVLEETGNDLLDNHSAGNEMDFPVDLGYRWDSTEDIETLKRLYVEAGPTWKRISELCGYLDSDEVIEDFLEELFYGETEDEDND